VIALNESLATGWRKRFLPALNVILKERLPKVPQQQHKYYLPVSRDVLMNYFLDYSICQLLGHQKHHIPSDEMKKARTGLIGTQRSKVIHSCLDLGDHQLAAIIRSWPRHLLQFLMLGSVHTVDETIVPYFGKMADAEGKLRHCPNKPHDFGMWVWVLASAPAVERPPAVGWPATGVFREITESGGGCHSTRCSCPCLHRGACWPTALDCRLSVVQRRYNHGAAAAGRASADLSEGEQRTHS
jgi:hypothetical protein